MELKYSQIGKVFYVRSTYEEREIPKNAGFTWHRYNKVWSTPNARIAGALREHADEEALLALDRATEMLEVGSRATSTAFRAPVPLGLEAYPYQHAGAEWALDKKRSLIADEMGLGKTVQAILVMNVELPPLSIIVCPASLKYNWLRELQKWFVAADDTCFRVMNGNLGRAEVHGKHWEEASHTVIIVNYDVVWKPRVHDTLRYANFDYVVLDECHYLKNHSTNRTKGVLGPHSFARKAGKVLALTGTPVLNRPKELYPILKNLAPFVIAPYSDYQKFTKFFCGGYHDKFGWNDRGATNTKELNERLRTGFMIRRQKKDVLKDLPPKRYQVIPLQSDQKVKTLIKNQAKGLGIKDFSRQEVPDDLGELAEERHELAMRKLPAAVAHIKDVLLVTDKVVVFAHHKDVISHLQKAFKGAVTIDGSTKNTDRQKAVDKFQEDSETKVFIGQLQAAGVGLTLTAASTVVFVEFSWVPGEITQAVDRCHRIGQVDNVLAHFLVIEDSLEEHMMRVVLEKVKKINQVVE